MLTVLLVPVDKLATAKSILPSPLKSPAAIPAGLVPAEYAGASKNRLGGFAGVSLIEGSVRAVGAFISPVRHGAGGPQTGSTFELWGSAIGGERVNARKAPAILIDASIFTRFRSGDSPRRGTARGLRLRAILLRLRRTCNGGLPLSSDSSDPLI